jgi:predicted DCC family thiol-disulfide oxidoreductase YuxK
VIEVFFDGACPKCVKISRLIKWADTNGRVTLTNLREDPSSLDFYDIDFWAATKTIHAVDDQGEVTRGYDVFLALLATLGWPRLSTLLGVLPLYYVGVGAYKLLNFVR